MWNSGILNDLCESEGGIINLIIYEDRVKKMLSEF